MVWAWQQDVSATETLVLLALADHADDTGFCWPGQSGLASKTKMSRPAVNGILKRLVEKGKVEVIHRQDEYNRHRTNQYQLRMGGTVIQHDTEPCHPDAESRVMEDDTNLQREPSKKETSAERLSPQDLADGWNDLCAPLGLPKVEIISATRRQKAMLRIHEHSDVEFWNRVFGHVRVSPFLLGRTNGNARDHKGWKASFDWLIENDTNCIKVYEGRYAKEV